MALAKSSWLRKRNHWIILFYIITILSFILLAPVSIFMEGVKFTPSYLQSAAFDRCWSPDLHRRFVDALQQLGGPHVATPKQIREVLQVNDLTDDEVKSHLQKHRLHVRKLPTGKVNCPWLGQDRVLNSEKTPSMVAMSVREEDDSVMLIDVYDL